MKTNEQFVNYVGFGLKLSDAEELSKKVARTPYSYDAEGKNELQTDLERLQDTLSALYLEYLNLRGNL